MNSETKASISDYIRYLRAQKNEVLFSEDIFSVMEKEFQNAESRRSLELKVIMAKGKTQTIINDCPTQTNGPLTQKKIEAAARKFLESKIITEQQAQALTKWCATAPLGLPYMENAVRALNVLSDSNGTQFLEVEILVCNWQLSFRHRYFFRPLQMNLELTSRCPLRCPQCYCDLEKGKDLSLENALYWLRDAAENFVQYVNLSGGETLVYPHLDTVIAECKKLGLESAIAISGARATKERLQKLIEEGVDEIFVSLNGSTEEINSRTRDGYDLAVNAIKLLQEIGFKNRNINWVMHSYNADNFSEMLKLAEKYSVKNLAVLVFKPDSKHQLNSMPTFDQMRSLAAFIKTYDGPVNIQVENCFSPMKALLGQKALFNTNIGIAKGCGAGRDGISVSADGRLTPCRHIEIEENYTSIKEYWEKSKTLELLRCVEDSPEGRCAECRFKNNCLPCNAVGIKMQDRIVMDSEACVMQ